MDMTESVADTKSVKEITLGDFLRSKTPPIQEVELRRIQTDLVRAAEKGNRSHVIATGRLSLEDLLEKLTGVELRHLKTDMGLVYVEVSW